MIVKWEKGTFGVVVGDEENDDAGHFLFDILKIHHIPTTSLNVCNYPAIYCLDIILIVFFKMMLCSCVIMFTRMSSIQILQYILRNRISNFDTPENYLIYCYNYFDENYSYANRDLALSPSHSSH